ncbi:MAG TPA: alternative ribosome rescue aminoacyl-tRNA hydrolase ArfB [Byssovorax sp.]|jgi:ribosome-associated protein
MLEPLVVREGVVIPPRDLAWSAVRSSGPGGQNVNKVASKVELRFDLAGTRALDPGTRARLTFLARGRLDREGKIVITSEETRDQARNLARALEKLVELVAQALVVPKRRRATRPSRGSVERRLDEKKRTGERKRQRSDPSER